MVVSRTWCMLKWKRTVYELLYTFHVSCKNLNSVQMIFDLTNSVLEWTNAPSWLDLMRCIFHSTTLSTVTL